MDTHRLEQAVAMIPDGASLMIGGFMAVGTPERIIDEIVRQNKRELTVIANDTAAPGNRAKQHEVCNEICPRFCLPDLSSPGGLQGAGASGRRNPACPDGHCDPQF
jgi:hypothetical protein